MPPKGYKKEICVNGHHKPTVGTAPNGWCLACRRESYEKRGLAVKSAPDPTNIRFRNPICPRGHDKRVVGVSKSYLCLACQKDHHSAQARRGYWRQYRRDQVGIDADPGPVSNLRQVRFFLHLSVSELASRIGCTPHTVRRLESRVPQRNASRVMQKRILEAVTPLLAAEKQRRRAA